MRSSSEWNETTTSRPPGLSTRSAALQRVDEFAKLVVDEDAQRLERARRRMDVAGRRAHDRRYDVGELARGLDAAPRRAP